MKNITKRIIGIFLVLAMMFTLISFIVAASIIKANAVYYGACTQCNKGEITYQPKKPKLAKIVQAGICYCVWKSPYRHETWIYYTKETLSCDYCNFSSLRTKSNHKPHCTGEYLK